MSSLAAVLSFGIFRRQAMDTPDDLERRLLRRQDNKRRAAEYTIDVVRVAVYERESWLYRLKRYFALTDMEGTTELVLDIQPLDGHRIEPDDLRVDEEALRDLIGDHFVEATIADGPPGPNENIGVLLNVAEADKIEEFLAHLSYHFDDDDKKSPQYHELQDWK